MSYRILTKNAVENTNIDGARDHNFNAGRRSGIVQGALNSGNLFLSANNTIALDTCELRLCGHRVVIDSAEYKTFYNQPSVPIRYSLVAQIIVSNNGESVSFDLKTQSSTTPLVQNDLDKNINGTYELEIGRFTQLTDGTLTDVVRTADLITGGAGGGDSEYIRIGTVTTNKISPELDADVDIENTINPDDNKPQTNFTFNLPTSVGTVVSVNGEEKTSINTDITPIASSENLITSGGVHDYPAVDFAESERQKSKNLFDTTKAENVGYNWNGTLNSNNSPNYISCGFIKIKPNTNYIFSLADSTITMNYTGVLFYTLDKTYISYVECNGNTFITPSNAEYMICQFWFESNPMNYKDIIQIEEGSAATEYQPYHGQITHNGDAPVDFAESERQKSKNLFTTQDNRKYGSSGTYNIVDLNSFSLSYGSGNMTWSGVEFIINNLKPNTAYNFSLICDVSYSLLHFQFYGLNTGAEILAVYGGYLIPFNTGDNTSIKIIISSGNNNIENTTFNITNVQLEEGSIATDYQPYNGAIVHEKQLPKITTLWTNPNPSNDFSSQTITLANDNYDYAIMICAGRTTELNTQVSFLFEKGKTPILNYVLTNAEEAYSVENMCRRVYYTNNTTLNVQDCYYSLKSNATIVGNNLLIPYKVIGIKMGE